ncbi:MAG: hypothetical protein MUC67_03450 [Acidobacteria bacterium]|jgi:hypothetical protein|nr:hypothetical protein [Acidobacteriota bacterium]
MIASSFRTPLAVSAALALVAGASLRPAGAAAPVARLDRGPAATLEGVVDPAALPVFAPEPGKGRSAPRLIPNVFPSPGEIPGGDAAGGIFPAPSDVGTTVVREEPADAPTALGADAPPAIDVRFDAPFDGGVAPPDSVLAVGRNHAVALINVQIAIYDKTGALKQGPFSLRSFFGIPSGWGDFDPLAIYDPHSDRYIVATLADNGSLSDSRIYIAFSQTNDATGAWNKYWIDADRGQPNNWADYASIGLDRNAVYLTANMFTRTGGYSNATLFIYDKEDGYAGRALDNTHLIDVRTASNAATYRLRPAFVGEAVPGDAYYLAHTDSGFGSLMNLFELTGSRFVSPVLTASTVPLPDLYFPPGKAKQPGGNPGVETLGANLWNVFYRSGKLWSAMSISGTSAIAAWVHRIDVSAKPFTREQTFKVELAGADLYFPHVIPDVEDNDFALFSAYSSTAVHPSARYTNVSAAGTIRYAENMATGTLRNDSGRHGDYFAAGVDPKDPNRYWAIVQYQKNSTFSGNSSIASVRFEDVPLPSGPPPVPDGKKVPGNQVRVQRAGGNVNITWDVTRCPPNGNHLVWYDLTTIASYTIRQTTCGAGVTGSWTGPAPTGNVGVLVVSNDGASTEGSYGPNSQNQERPSSTSACGITAKNVGGICP